MDKSKARILYVEDYPVVQTMYVDILRKHGFDVDVVSDGKEALEKVAQNTYSLVLLDLLLPQVTGIEFLREFRSKGLPGEVVVLSDFDSPEMMKETADLGVAYYWVKVDNTPYKLVEHIEQVINDLPEQPTK